MWQVKICSAAFHYGVKSAGSSVSNFSEVVFRMTSTLLACGSAVLALFTVSFLWTRND